jgi:hypothetical protein
MLYQENLAALLGGSYQRKKIECETGKKKRKRFEEKRSEKTVKSFSEAALHA